MNKWNKKKTAVFLILLFSAFFLGCYLIYFKDKKKYEPKLWIGALDYRLNFRDLGVSLNQCLNKDIFAGQLVYRSNKYFSGWSCAKIHDPKKIYSLNFSPWEPHSYYCTQPNGSRLYGIHPNTTFEISDIEQQDNWKRPEFKETMCIFFQDVLLDIAEVSPFLFHCDVGRDRTGAFAALLAAALGETAGLDMQQTKKAIECDYEKTHALEPFKKGRMVSFLEGLESFGGPTKFLIAQCQIPRPLLEKAARAFVLRR